jgi:radical SAM superfamily enzyme YgiQ (UPF0313 family)
MALAGKRLQWFGQISTNALKNPDLIDLAAKAGCKALFIGVESLSTASLKTVNKHFNKVEEYAELIARVKKAGILPFLSFVFGFDGDTPDQFDLTLRFLKRNRVGYAVLWLLTPLPGTDLFAELKRDGRIETEDWSQYDLTHVVFRPKNFDGATLAQEYWATFRSMYSWGSVVRNTYYNTSCSRSPISELSRNLFYQFYFRSKVRSCDHPFSGGIGLVS